MVKVAMHDSYGNLALVGEKRNYFYRHVSPFQLKKVKRFIKQKRFGEMFNYLRPNVLEYPFVLEDWMEPYVTHIEEVE